MVSESLPLIAVDRLQPGMFVVLDLGWQQHPFAFNRFTLRSQAQIDQLRELGCTEVHWCPKRSVVMPAAEPAGQSPAAPPDPSHANATDAASSIGPAAQAARALASATGQRATPSLIASAAANVRAIDTPLQRQQSALARLEDAFGHATRLHQQLLRQVLVDPGESRRIAEALTRQLLEAVADERDVSLRLLSDCVGDRPSAHDIGVAVLAVLLGRECGFADDELRELTLAGLLHDIGKQRIPAFLHEDHGRLTDFERRSYRRHVEFGLELAVTLGVSRAVQRAIAEHHERYDGGGFPAALRREQLSPAGRVLSIVNRYQSLVCPSHIDAGLTPHLALKQMYSAERTHFDPVFLPRFVRILGIYPPGTLVELTDHRMAIVVASRPGMSLAPKVQIIDTPDHFEPSLTIDLDPTDGLGVQCSLRVDQLNPRWAQRARQFARAPCFFQPVERQVAAIAN